LAGIDYLQRKKILKSCNLQNRPFWPIPSTSVLPAVAPFSLILGKLEKLKAWKNRNVPIYLFHASVKIENCMGLRKKFLG